MDDYIKRNRPTIGILINCFEGDFVNTCLNYVYSLGEKLDVNIIFFPIEPSPYSTLSMFDYQNKVVLNYLTKNNIDVLIALSGTLCNKTDSTKLQSLYGKYFKVPTINVSLKFQGIPSIVCDNLNGMYEVIKHLIVAHNRKRIAFIKGIENHLEAEERYKAYIKVLKDFNIPFDPDLVLPGRFIKIDGNDAVKALIDIKKAQFDAVAACNDEMAIGAMEELKVRDINVPNDVSVVGFDNVSVSKLCQPQITTVDQNIKGQIEKAFELAIKLANENDVQLNYSIPGKIIYRTSCGCVSPEIKKYDTIKFNLNKITSEKKQAVLEKINNTAESIDDENNSMETVFKLLEISEYNKSIYSDILNKFNNIFIHDKNIIKNFEYWTKLIDLFIEYVSMQELPVQKQNDIEVFFFKLKMLLTQALNKLQHDELISNQAKKQERYFNWVTSFSSNISLPDLIAELINFITNLGNASAYITMYEKEIKVLNNSEYKVPKNLKMLMAFNGSELITIDEKNRTFSSRYIVPKKFLPQNRRFVMVINPLFFREYQFGFFALELDRFNVDMYESIRVQLSNAIKVWLLLEDEQKSHELLKQQKNNINTLLNNSGEGFLSFGPNLIIDDEYSDECVKIFDKKIKDCNILDLLFENDEENKELSGKIYEKIFMGEDSCGSNKYLQLMPSELIINNKYINIQHKIIHFKDHIKILLILNDITDKKALENKIENEKNKMKMVVKAVADKRYLINLIRDYLMFCETDLKDLMKACSKDKQILNLIFRKFHTFKGCFYQFEMKNVSDYLHKIESKISILLKESSPNINIEKYLNTNKLKTVLNKDLNVLRSYLGDEYFSENEIITIEEEKLLEVEKKMKKLLPQKFHSEVSAYIKELKYRPFKNLVDTYPEYVVMMAERLERPIKEFTIEGGNFQVDADTYNDFAKSLIHVFRNAIVHGIEPVDLRLKHDKELIGSISCKIKTMKNQIYLWIKDDGKGIDIEEIKKIAIERNICDKASLSKLSEEEILQIIFCDQFSTKSDITYLAGRGVGLSSIKYEVDKLGGDIIINSEKNKFTEFCFVLPLL